MNVLTISEDHTKDQFVLKPIVQAMFDYLKIPSVTIQICNIPRLRGVSQCLDWNKIKTIVDQYCYRVDLFLLIVDRDGDANRWKKLRDRENRASELLKSNSTNKCLLAENAWQEIEVWLLAGHDIPNDWSWQSIRNDLNPKENYYIPFASGLKMIDGVADGRKDLALDAAKKYKRIRDLCQEDVRYLEARISDWISQKAQQ